MFLIKVAYHHKTGHVVDGNLFTVKMIGALSSDLSLIVISSYQRTKALCRF